MFEFTETVEDLSSVPEQFRPFYVEGDGNHILDTENPVVSASVQALQGQGNALKKSRAEADRAKKSAVDLTPLSDYGSNVEEIVEAFNTKIEELSSKDKDTQTTIAKARADLEAKFQKDVAAKDEVISGLTGQLHGLMVTTAAQSALVEAGVIDPDLALPHIEQRVKVQQDDGQYQVRVVDADGDARYSTVTSDFMTITELVSEMKSSEKFAPLFTAQKPKGMGTDQSKPRRSASGPKREDRSSADKISDGLKELIGQGGIQKGFAIGGE